MRWVERRTVVQLGCWLGVFEVGLAWSPTWTASQDCSAETGVRRCCLRVQPVGAWKSLSTAAGVGGWAGALWKILSSVVMSEARPDELVDLVTSEPLKYSSMVCPESQAQQADGSHTPPGTQNARSNACHKTGREQNSGTGWEPSYNVTSVTC